MFSIKLIIIAKPKIQAIDRILSLLTEIQSVVDCVSFIFLYRINLIQSNFIKERAIDRSGSILRVDIFQELVLEETS